MAIIFCSNKLKIFFCGLFIFGFCLAESDDFSSSSNVAIVADDKVDVAPGKVKEDLEKECVDASECGVDFAQDREIEIANFSDTEPTFDASSALDLQQTSTADLSINDNFSEKKRSEFYKKYIAKFYPKAYVIWHKLYRMKVDDIPAAINDLVYVFTKEPWFYFQNKPEQFRLIYFWEYVIDQCTILHEFFSKVRVDLKTKKLFVPNHATSFNYWSSYSNLSSENANSVSLAEYLKKRYVNAYSGFYALCFDYLVKMFNEGVLLKDMGKIDRYLYEIEYMYEKLEDTPSEADYSDAIKTCKQIYEISRKKIGYNSYENYFNNQS